MDHDRRALIAHVGGAVRVAIPLAFLGVFFAWPVAAILRCSFRANAFVDVLRDGALRHIVWFTFWQAVVSTVLTLLVGLPIAFVVARYRFRGRALFRAFVTVPFVLPTVVVATAFLVLLRPGGPLAFLHWDRGLGPMLIAHVFFNVAVVVRTVGGFWEHLDPRREDAARMLGASRRRTWREVTLPMLMPAIAGASAIVFLFTFTSFGVALLLADPSHATLEVEIYRQTVDFFDLPTAAGLAVVQMLAVIAITWVFGWLESRRAIAQRLLSSRDTSRRPRGRERWLVALVMTGAVVFLGGPLVVLASRSFDGGSGWGLSAYRALGSSASANALFVSPWEAVRNSLVFAAIATVLAVIVGGLASIVIARHTRASGRAFDTLLMLPLGTSAVTVGFGLLLALDRGPFDIANRPILVPIAQAVVAVPFVVRATVPALRSIDARLRDAASTLGASPGQVWREVDLPIVLRALLVGAAFAAAISLGEFGATVFVARPDSPTLPVAIARFLSRPGIANVDQAMAMSTILMVLTGAVVLAIERVRVRRLGVL